MMYALALANLVRKEAIDGVWRTILFAVRSWFFDAWYHPTSLDTLSRMLEEYRQFLEQEKLVYEAEVFDCDDFATTFKTFFTRKTKLNSVGIALGTVTIEGGLPCPHAWNIVLAAGAQIVMVEPQTQEILSKRGKTYYSSEGWAYKLMAVVW